MAESSVVVFSDALESYTPQLSITLSYKPYSPACIYLSFLHTNNVPLSCSPQPDSTPDLPSTFECITSRNKSTMCVHVHLAFKGLLLSYSSGHTDYELARTFHPDSPASQALSSSVRHARFHAVTRAYDILRGRSNAHLGNDLYNAELSRRRQQHVHRHVYYQRASSESEEAGGMNGADDAWKDQVIIIVGLAVRTSPSLRPRV
jgi:hypothetical protein